MSFHGGSGAWLFWSPLWFLLHDHGPCPSSLCSLVWGSILVVLTTQRSLGGSCLWVFLYLKTWPQSLLFAPIIRQQVLTRQQVLSAAFGRQWETVVHQLPASKANVKGSPRIHGRDYTLHLAGGVINWVRCSTLLPAGCQPLG